MPPLSPFHSPQLPPPPPHPQNKNENKKQLTTPKNKTKQNKTKISVFQLQKTIADKAHPIMHVCLITEHTLLPIGQ